MAKNETNKVRTIAVYRILERGEKMTLNQIRCELVKKYGIKANRQSIIGDIYAVDRFIPIEITYGCHGGYQRVDVVGRCGDG